MVVRQPRDAERPAFTVGRLLVFFRRRLILSALRCPLQHIRVRHARAAAAAQSQQSADDDGDRERDNEEGLQCMFPGNAVTLINPSCAALATSRPSRANTLPRANPRAPEALGLSMAYSSQSSTRTLR